MFALIIISIFLLELSFCDKNELAILATQCGYPSVDPLESDTFTQQAYPWVVAIYYNDNKRSKYKCSGTLISKNLVVTVTACVSRQGARIQDPKSIFAILGNYANIENETNYEQIVEADAIYVHSESRVVSVGDADIAVIRLSKMLVFNDNILPICFWRHNNSMMGVGVVLTKHRHDVERGEPKRVRMPIVAQEVCRKSASEFVHFTSNRTFCAGEQNGDGPCFDDVGAGFVMDEGGKWVLRGLVALMLAKVDEETDVVECDLGHYVVFTDVSKHVEWLNSFF